MAISLGQMLQILQSSQGDLQSNLAAAQQAQLSNTTSAAQARYSNNATSAAQGQYIGTGSTGGIMNGYQQTPYPYIPLGGITEYLQIPPILDPQYQIYPIRIGTPMPGLGPIYEVTDPAAPLRDFEVPDDMPGKFDLDGEDRCAIPPPPVRALELD